MRVAELLVVQRTRLCLGRLLRQSGCYVGLIQYLKRVEYAGSDGLIHSLRRIHHEISGRRYPEYTDQNFIRLKSLRQRGSE